MTEQKRKGEYVGYVKFKGIQDKSEAKDGSLRTLRIVLGDGKQKRMPTIFFNASIDKMQNLIKYPAQAQEPKASEVGEVFTYINDKVEHVGWVRFKGIAPGKDGDQYKFTVSAKKGTAIPNVTAYASIDKIQDLVKNPDKLGDFKNQTVGSVLQYTTPNNQGAAPVQESLPNAIQKKNNPLPAVVDNSIPF